MFLAVYTPFLNKVLETTPLRAVDMAVVFGLGFFEILFVEAIKWCFRVRGWYESASSLSRAKTV